MAQYPVTDQQGIIDGLNYTLSGPVGLGQNFSGFSSYASAFVTGNFRTPYTQSTTANLYVAPIALSNAVQLDSRTIQYTFASAQPSPPFSLGNGIFITGITPTDYNSSDLKNAGNSIYPIGVIECTTTTVTVRTIAPIVGTLPAYVSGGAADYSSTDTGPNSTDCDVRVTVTSAQDQVFISGQLDQIISYAVSTAPADMTVRVSIDRYAGSPNYDPINPDYLFEYVATPVQKDYVFTGLTGTGTLNPIETVFSGVLDRPGPGFYRYILQVEFIVDAGVIEVTTDEISLRSITAQVVKP